MAERRSTKHESGAIGTCDPKGEIRVTARDHVEREGPDGTVDVRLQPARDGLDIDSRYGVHVISLPSHVESRVLIGHR